MRDQWSTLEIEATVEAYFDMLHMDQQGEKYAKAEINRSLRAGALSKRSKGSVEFKFGNISSVLREAGLPWIQGYKPYPNVQKALRECVIVVAEKQGFLPPEDHHPTHDNDLLKERVKRIRTKGLKEKPLGNKKPEKSATGGLSFRRDPEVVAWVMESANGICGFCGQPAPFKDSSGKPFLEIHHIVWLSEGGEDTVENAVALCPNCHRKAHYGYNRDKLKAKLA